MTRKDKFTRPADMPGRVCRVLEGMVADDEDPYANMVYRFAHIASGRCGNQHENWLAEFERVEEEIEESYYTSPLELAEREREAETDLAIGGASG